MSNDEKEESIKEILDSLISSLAGHTRTANWLWIGLIFAATIPIANYFAVGEYCHKIPILDIKVSEEGYYFILTLAISILSIAFSLSQASALKINNLIMKKYKHNEELDRLLKNTIKITNLDYLDALKPSCFHRVHSLSSLGETDSLLLYKLLKHVALTIYYIIPFTGLFFSFCSFMKLSNNLFLKLLVILIFTVSSIAICVELYYEYAYYRKALENMKDR